jgi:hypothetical protein
VNRVNGRRPLRGLLGLGGPLRARFVLPYRATGGTLEPLELLRATEKTAFLRSTSLAPRNEPLIPRFTPQNPWDTLAQGCP